jgi:hypothetical protein
MPIIVYKEFTAVRSGVTTREERCEKCAKPFWYEVEVTVQGGGSSPFFLTNEKAKRDAVRRAEHHLKYALENAVRPVPCPHCGWYQKPMVRMLLDPRLRWMRFFAWITLFGGAFFVWTIHVMLNEQGRHPKYPERPYVILAWCLLPVICWATLFLRTKLVAAHDPNQNWTPAQAADHTG